MKTTPRQLHFAAALACFGALTLATLAQTAREPAAPTTVAATTSAPAPTVTPSSAVAAPAAVSETVTASSPTSSTSVPSAPASSENAKTAVATQSNTAPESTANMAPGSGEGLRRLDEQKNEPATTKSAKENRHVRVRHGRDNGRVAIFNNALLGPNESADSVVAICGNATSEGEVSDAVVAVCGNARATGPVGDSVVAVLGNAYVNTEVSEVVAVLGNVDLGPNAEVRGDVVCVGGVVTRDPKAVVRGNIPNVGIGPVGWPNMGWLQAYVHHCVIKLRPLAIAPHMAWAWYIAAGFLGLYALLAFLFRSGVDKCVQVLETRPGGSLIAALVTMVLMPVLFVLSIVTIVGVVVLPCAFLFGKVVMFAWLGRQVTRHFGDGPLTHPAFGVLIGGLIVTALYLIPVFGFVVQNVLGIVGLGVVVYSLLLAVRRDKPAPAATPAVAAMPAAATVAAGSVAGTPVLFAAPETVGTAVPPVVAATLPRAGFWIRTGALLIDILLVSLVYGIAGDIVPRFLHVHGPGPLLLGLAAYGAILWKLKGSTIGGIICGLKVVRLDNRPIDWATSIVRALACFLSLMVAGLGFIWVAVDEEKQSWHDKIAGTTVIFARGSVTLV